MPQVKISVIIPTYNRKERLIKCLSVLLKQNYPKEDYEIIIVDDGSTDGTKEAIAALKDVSIKYYQQKNKGPGAAINTGANIAEGGILAFTEDDCIVGEDWLKNVMVLFKNYPNAAAFTGPCLTAGLEKISKKIAYRKQENIKKMDLKKLDTFLNIGNGSYAIKKEIFLKMKGYDENFRTQEDWEFNIRLLKERYEIYITNKLEAIHYPRQNLKDSFIKAYIQGMGHVRLLKIYFGRHTTVHLCLASFNIDKHISFSSPFTIFIKIHFIKILIFLSTICIFYQNSYLSALLIIACVIFIFRISLQSIIDKAGFFMGHIAGSIKYKAFVF